METGKTVILSILVIGLFFVGLFLAIYGSRIKEGKSAMSLYLIACCLVVASVISCSLSFLAICLAFENGNAWNLYQQDVIVDIFAILVTVLMGWNIISVVDIKRDAEKVNAISKDLESVIIGMLQLNFHSFNMREDREKVIDSCFETLLSVHDCENKVVRMSAEKAIVKLLDELKSTYGKEDQVEIYPGNKERYLFALHQLNDVFIKDVEEMINSAKDSKIQNENKTIAYNYKTKEEEETEYIKTL